MTILQEYRTRSSHGYYNQGWKDAGDAIPHEDGLLAPLPIALCELQGYVLDAKVRMGDVYELLGRKADARRLRREAKELYERFNETFWWEEEGPTTSASMDPPTDPDRLECGPPAPIGDRPPERRAGSSSGFSRTTCGRVGDPDRLISIPPTTRSAITPAPSGPTTTR